MSQIKCPNCGTVFQVDESQYHEILQQVRNEEFEKELNERQKNSNQIIQSKLGSLTPLFTIDLKHSA